MSDLDARAETAKLARLLGVPAESLAFLENAAAPATRQFRESVSDALYNRNRQNFERLARLSRVLPAGPTAKLTEDVLGATLAGRVAGELSPDAAVKLAERLSPKFLADVCLELDPRRAGPIIRRMPASVVVPVALLLAARKDFITMGRFVDSLAEDVLDAVIVAIKSDEVLLRTGFFVENKSRLDAVMRLLPAARLRGAILAAKEHALWPEALSLILHLKADLKGRLGNLVAEQSEEVLEDLAAAAQRQDLWPAMLEAVAAMTAENQRRVVNMPALQSPEVLTGIIVAANASKMWNTLLPLAPLMAPGQREQLVRIALEQPSALIRDLFGAAAQHDLWPAALGLLSELPEKIQQQLGRRAADGLRDVYAEIRRAAESLGMLASLSAVDVGYRAALGSP